MKRYILLLLAIVALTAITAQETKLGWVNTEMLLMRSNDAARISADFEQQRTAWVDEIKALDERIKALEANLEIDRLVKTQAALEADRARINQLKTQAGQLLERYFGENGMADELYEQLLQPLTIKIQEAISEVSALEGYMMVFDVTMGVVLYAMPEHDLTLKVLEILNRNTEPPSTEIIDE